MSTPLTPKHLELATDDDRGCAKKETPSRLSVSADTCVTSVHVGV